MSAISNPRLFSISQVELLVALEQNISWIKKSFSVNNNEGSSKYCTSWGRWSLDYPETSGYLIETLIRASKYLNDVSLIDLTHLQIPYFRKLQLPSGAFKSQNADGPPFVFDSAQILLGLCAYYQSFQSKDVLEMINACYNWLIKHLDDNGCFIKYNYLPNYNPAYYSRILWPMLLSEKFLGLPNHNKSKALLDRIISLKENNHSFRQCGFSVGRTFLTHNLIYTYRGLWESSLLLNDQELQNSIVTSLNFLCHNIINPEGWFWGEYDLLWKGNTSFICSVGNAQLICLLSRINEASKDNSYDETMKLLFQPLYDTQRSFNAFNAGAIPSSIPVWGKYQRFRYTNWTQKFYSDALMDMLS